MAERRELIAQDYQQRLSAHNDRLGLCHSSIKPQVHELLRNWIQVRNDICHTPGYIEKVDYDSFYRESSRVQKFLREHTMDLDGTLADQFSVIY